VPPKTQPRHTLTYQLREIVASRGLTAQALGQMAEVDPGVISRFLNGRRDIRMETADRLALALGLRLTELARPTGRVRPAKVARPARTRVEQVLNREELVDDQVEQPPEPAPIVEPAPISFLARLRAGGSAPVPS
jgi:transcriptional regulator with XRE-family HTH domain